MKRVGLFLSAVPHLGGTFQYNLAMLAAVAALPCDRFEVVVVYIDPCWEAELQAYDLPVVRVAPHLVERGLSKLWRLSTLSPTWWRALAPHFHSITRQIMARRCDIWLYPSFDPWVYQVPAPALVSIHDVMHRYESHFPEMASLGMFESRERHYANTCRWAKGILVDSVIGKQHVQDCYAVEPQRIYVLPFIPPKYVLEEQTPSTSDRLMTLPHRFIFYPAQFWEHKNHQRLIQAIAVLLPVIPDLQLVLVGSRKNGYTAARQLVQRLNVAEHIHFLGYVSNEEMVELYRRARAMIMPTFFGPTNIPPLEAHALGCPVAVSRIYGMPEQLGDAALFFDPMSVEEIAQTILRLWQDDALCADLRQRGLAQAQRWTQADFNQRVAEIITAVLTPDTVDSFKHVPVSRLAADQ